MYALNESSFRIYFNWTKSAIKIKIDSQNETEMTLNNGSYIKCIMKYFFWHEDENMAFRIDLDRMFWVPEASDEKGTWNIGSACCWRHSRVTKMYSFYVSSFQLE